ncbi:component of the polarisome [Tulasnella sp. 330]|nr:component of the polarisome [Tulasnella sp. 330]KAG8882083.1 component of the polarisome [Tulasnella sp. 331]
MSRRPSSPATTTYSGQTQYSSYRSDAYRPMRDHPEPGPKSAPPEMDGRQIAREHYEELSVFLASHLAKEPANSRSSAREKLTRLTKQQFQELSTDVYDELVRRNNNSEQNDVPFLPVRDDFHPKRNQARQKLATLPKTRFKDLSSDVFFELGRRYPEFKEPEVPDTPDDPDYPPDSRRQQSQDSFRDQDDQMRQTSKDTISNGPLRKPSQDNYGDPRRGPNLNGQGRASPYGDPRRPSEDNTRDGSMKGSSTRRPSEDTLRSVQHKQRPSKDAVNPGGALYRGASQDSDGYSPAGAPSTATSGVVIPNKSTIAEEEIQVPYGRDDDESRDFDSASERGGPVDPKRFPPHQPNRSLSQGLNALGTSLLNGPISPGTDEDGGMDRDRVVGRGQGDYYDTRASTVSTGSVLAGANGGRGTREEREAAEQMRSEYEFKIATMQNRISTLETDLANTKDRRSSGEINLRNLTRDLEDLQAKTEDQTTTIRSLQRDLEEAQTGRAKEARRNTEYENQIQDLQDRIEDLQANSGSRRGAQDAATNEMRSEMQNLVTELKDLARRNDELLEEKDADLAVIHSLTNQLSDSKRKYEHAKTELRKFRATSQLFHVATPKSDDSLPMADNGGILDIHVDAFQTAIDSLLSVTRSNNPSGVFTPMRSVVTAVTTITDDMRVYEQRPSRDRHGHDDEALRLMRERVDATLSNLVAATKNHAMSHGLSPVSLIDAAASHVSAAVVAVIHAVMIRKSTEEEREREPQILQRAESSLSNGVGLGFRSVTPPGANGKSTAPLRGPDSRRVVEPHGRTPSDTSQWSSQNGNRSRDDSPLGKAPPPNSRRKPTRQNTSSDRSSNPSPQPPPIFDTPNMSATNGGSEEEGSEGAWEELKPYLDAQAEAIVLPIRNLLSAIRAGAGSAELNENLTQIITIVSSIVAVCRDSLPVTSGRIGEDIIRQLSDNCDKLSELQSLGGEITKPTRQAMASSSFAVAKAMKELRAM